MVIYKYCTKFLLCVNLFLWEISFYSMYQSHIWTKMWLSDSNSQTCFVLRCVCPHSILEYCCEWNLKALKRKTATKTMQSLSCPYHSLQTCTVQGKWQYSHFLMANLNRFIIIVTAARGLMSSTWLQPYWKWGRKYLSMAWTIGAGCCTHTGFIAYGEDSCWCRSYQVSGKGIMELLTELHSPWNNGNVGIPKCNRIIKMWLQIIILSSRYNLSCTSYFIWPHINFDIYENATLTPSGALSVTHQCCNHRMQLKQHCVSS